MFEAFEISAVPGLAEYIARKRYQTASERESAFLGKTHMVCGVKLRAMTVMDFTVLSHLKNPLLNNQNPTLKELLTFMWVLQAKTPKHFRLIRAWNFGRRCRKLVPEQAAIECLQYVDRMFADVPASCGQSEPNTSLVASWCHTILSTYASMNEKDVFGMALPKLWQYLRCIKQDRNPGAPEQNRSVDLIINGILEGLNRHDFTADDLLAGRVDLGLN